VRPARDATSLLAAGIDPNVATLFVSRRSRNISELADLSRMQRRVGASDAVSRKNHSAKRASTSCADVSGACKRRDILPVSRRSSCLCEDQVQHLELSRVMRAAGTRSSGAARNTFGAQAAAVPPTPRIMGLDARRRCPVDGQHDRTARDAGANLGQAAAGRHRPKRVKRTDPGTPEVCNIFHLHKSFSPGGNGRARRRSVQHGGWGCIDCKRRAAREHGAGAHADSGARQRAQGKA